MDEGLYTRVLSAAGIGFLYTIAGATICLSGCAIVFLGV
jgi:hypothetical protein